MYVLLKRVFVMILSSVVLTAVGGAGEDPVCGDEPTRVVVAGGSGWVATPR